MVRLSDRAFKILRTELQKCSGTDMASKVQQDIVLKRLNKLCLQSGSPVSLEELRQAVIDFYPNFSEKVLKEAVAANRPPGPWGTIKWAALFLTGAAGLVWVANLPYPMIRWPVAKTVPIVLLPSYMSMDYNYRQAISLVEQADQLVNKATASADFDLGELKAKEAQKHLDGLPVWFLGYFPEKYCSFFGCSWRFTFDEFEEARKNVGRIQAKVFQEKNAQSELTQAEGAVNAAKQQYKQGKTPAEKQEAIVAWQAAIDQLEQTPPATLAGKMAQKKVEAQERDFKQQVGYAAGNERTGNLIEAAKAFGLQAAVASQKPPHSADRWEEIDNLWDKAIDQLQQVSRDDPGYLDAQTKLAEYVAKRGTVQTHLSAEKDSVRALEESQEMTQNLIASMPRDGSPMDRNSFISKMQGIITQLKKVKPGTTAYAEAQQLLKSAQKKMKESQGN